MVSFVRVNMNTISISGMKNSTGRSIADVSNLLFINDQGQQVRLSQFAAVREGSGPSQLERRDKSTSVTIQAQSVGRPSGTVAAEWQAMFDKLPRPVGVGYVWSGDMENQSEGFGSMGIALLAAIVLVYLIMVALYNSFVYPFVVLFSIPLAIIGAFPGVGAHQQLFKPVYHPGYDHVDWSGSQKCHYPG